MIGAFGAVISVVLGAYVGSFLNMAIFRLPRRVGLGDIRHERRRLAGGGTPAAGDLWTTWVDDIPALPPALRAALRRAHSADAQQATLAAAETHFTAGRHPWRSVCPRCHHPLGVWDLIPIGSYLVLGGRCRHCRQRIAPLYLLVELLTVAAFLGVWWAVFHRTLLDPWLAMDLLAYWVFTAVLVAVVFIDYEHRIIPHELVLVALTVGVVRDGISLVAHRYGFLVVHVPVVGWALPLPPSLVGIVLGFALFAGVDLFGRLLFRREEAMGGGDANLGAAIGAVLGPWPALLSFAGAILLGGVFGAGLMAVWALRSGVKGAVGHYMPFGPYMAVTAYALLLWVAAYGWGGVLQGLLSGWDWWVSAVGG